MSGCSGPTTPTRCAPRSNIAAWTGQVGEPAEALRLFRALLPDHERVLGADHPETLTTRRWIADLQQQIGDDG